MDDNIEKVMTAKESSTEVSKCPRCGSNLKYTPESGRLECEYCGYEKNVDFSSQAEEIDFSHLFRDGNKWSETHAFVCNNCGARQILSKNEIAVNCSFCGTSNIVESKDLCGLRPNAVLPFLIGNKQACENAKKWAKKKAFAPTQFKKSLNAEKLTGNYIPAFTFDSDTFSTYTAKLGRNESITVKDKDGGSHTETKTEWFYVSGSYKKFFNDILIQASELVSQKTINRIKPFETDYAREYSSEFLHGFRAMQYEKDGERCWREAKYEMQKSVESLILSGYHYDELGYIHCDMQCSNITYKYVLLPLYIGYFNYKKKLYNFFVNGQNGKVTGKTPVSAGKILLVVGICLLIIAGLLVLLEYEGVL